MAVLINTKICDNAAECGGIAVCPTGALFWDEIKEKISIDNNLCISCHECEGECPVEAIKVAESDAEYEKMQDEIARDKRTPEELFVERYGAMPIDENALISEVDDVMDGTDRLIFIEQFCDDSIQCLLHSIPIQVLIKRYGCRYYKQQVEGGEELPRLLIYQHRTLLGQIEGYFSDNDIDALLSKIDHILNEEK